MSNISPHNDLVIIVKIMSLFKTEVNKLLDTRNYVLDAGGYALS